MKKVFSLFLVLIMIFAFSIQSFALDDIGGGTHTHKYYTVQVYELEALKDIHWHIYTNCYIYETFRVVVTECNCGSVISTRTSIGLRHDLWI